MMNKKKQWEQLAKYFAGELIQEEEQEMELWIKADPKREERVQKLYKIWKESKIPPYEKLNVDKAWDELSDDMDRLDIEKKQAAQTPDHVHSIEGRSSRKGSRYFRNDGSDRSLRRIATTVTAAAVLIVVGLFGYYGYDNYKPGINNSAEVTIEKLEAQKGERATYMLSDGSRVILHAESKLEVPIRFTGDTREIFLEGEAYFEVAEDSERPFIIRSEQAYTRVLGTKFLVQAWPEYSQTEVVVEEGKVAFGKSTSVNTTNTRDEEEVVLTGNQKGVLDKDQLSMVTDVADLEWYFGWTKGQLVFENRSLKEVIPKLERWYALDIQLEDESIANKKLSAEIVYTQPMDEVLKGIALSLELEINRTGRVVTYKKK